MVRTEIPRRRIAPDGAACASGGAQADGGGSHLFAELALCYRVRHFSCRDYRWIDYGIQSTEIVADVWEDADASALLVAYDCGYVVDRLHDPLLGARCHHGVGLCAHRRALSVFWNHVGMVRRGADWLGHRVQRAVRQPAENFCGTSRSVPYLDGGGE